jgi:hypothetical protein
MAKGILGKLPQPWDVGIENDIDGYRLSKYTNSLTGSITFEDPRLGPLSPDWVRLDEDDPNFPGRPLFKNQITGERTWLDLRLHQTFSAPAASTFRPSRSSSLSNLDFNFPP